MTSSQDNGTEKHPHTTRRPVAAFGVKRALTTAWAVFWLASSSVLVIVSSKAAGFGSFAPTQSHIDGGGALFYILMETHTHSHMVQGPVPVSRKHIHNRHYQVLLSVMLEPKIYLTSFHSDL